MGGKRGKFTFDSPVKQSPQVDKERRLSCVCCVVVVQMMLMLCVLSTCGGAYHSGNLTLPLLTLTNFCECVCVCVFTFLFL